MSYFFGTMGLFTLTGGGFLDTLAEAGLWAYGLCTSVYIIYTILAMIFVAIGVASMGMSMDYFSGKRHR